MTGPRHPWFEPSLNLDFSFAAMITQQDPPLIVEVEQLPPVKQSPPGPPVRKRAKKDDGESIDIGSPFTSLSFSSPGSRVDPSSSPQSSKGGNREQTLPTKSNPNPDLTDAGEAENR